MVSDSVSKKFGIEKSIGFGIEKKLVLKKVSDSVSKKFGIEKSIGFGIGNIWYRKKSRIRYQIKFAQNSWICPFETWFCKIWYRYWYWFRNFSNFLDGIGFGIEKMWYRKKYRIRYRKNWFRKKVSDLVSEKVSDSVSKKIWYRKKYRIRYRKNLVSEKSFGFGFVQILGIVTHWVRGEALSDTLGKSTSAHLAVGPTPI